MKVAAFLNNIVPYHDARWREFSHLYPSCHLVEISNRDEFRSLEFTDGGESTYRRHTLFPGKIKADLGGAKVVRAVEQWLNKEHPDVVVLNGWSFPYNLRALAWSQRKGVPCVVCSESNEFDEPRSFLKEFLKRRIVSLCSAGLAGGTPQAEYLVKLGIPKERVFLGYDVVDSEFFQIKASEAKKTEIPDPYFFACARFSKKKNLPGLIRAYAEYRKGLDAVPPYELVIAGEGEERGDIERTIRELGLGTHVHLVGSKGYEELPAFYANASAFIHASTTEQWGLVVNEAMASGLPVLVSNRCGFAADLVREGENGWTFDPADEEKLALLMVKISVDESLRIAMGRKSREIIKAWGPSRFASGLGSAIQSACIASKRRSHLLDRLILWLMSHR